MAALAQDRDEGLKRAFAAAGGRAKLAKALGMVRPQSLVWRRVPRARLLEVARITRIPAEELRPDLADWILEERRRERARLAREQFSLVRAAVGAPPEGRRSLDDVTRDILVTFAALRFVARERNLALVKMVRSLQRDEASARAWAMALALVAGRARATTIGFVCGVSRQAVDNAGERYLRARDGDDPEDFLGGEARVIERGRVRPAKAATGGLWEAELRFAAEIAEGDGQVRRAG